MDGEEKEYGPKQEFKAPVLISESLSNFGQLHVQNIII